jgi:hypothetical protein
MEQYVVTDDGHTPEHVTSIEEAIALVLEGLQIGKTVVISRVWVPLEH